MEVSAGLWRACIGRFHASSKCCFLSFYILVFNLILPCDDFEENARPKTKPNDNLSECHWNVNGMPSHNFL